MKEDILRVRDIVAEVLAVDKRARVNDLYLLLKVYQKHKLQGITVTLEGDGRGRWYIDLEDWAVDELPKPESISRCRRKLQEHGMYQPNGRVRKKEELEADMVLINQWWK